MRFLIFLLCGGLVATKVSLRPGFNARPEHRKKHPQNFNLPSHSNADAQRQRAQSIPDLQTIYLLTEKNSEFGFNVYRKIANLHENNVFFSPNSISTIFAMLSLGAKGATRTNLLRGLNIEELASTGNQYQLHGLFQWLHRNLTNNRDLLISQGNSLFIHNNFELKQTFIKDLSHFYNTDITLVNFQDTINTKGIINQYIRNRTDGKINKLLESVDSKARLMFINYILFKGKWKVPFDPNLTVNGTFYVNAYTRVKVPMMYKEGPFLLAYDKNHSCTVLKLPYKGSASMLVVMPTDAGSQLLEDELSTELIDQWMNTLRNKHIDLYFPKFKLEKSYKMERKLRQLGMITPFSNAADLSGISSSHPLKISEVIHKAAINVDEKGTEAAAVTGGFAIPYSLPLVIKIDHPFIFMIHEDITKTLLFMGRVKDPTKL